MTAPTFAHALGSGIEEYQMAQLRALGDLKTECWQIVRDGKVRDFLAASKRLEALCEEFRAAHFPDARELFVICDHTIGQPLSVYVRTADGVVAVFEDVAS
jgi:hypothetical protein